MDAPPIEPQAAAPSEGAPALAPRFAVETDRLLGLDEVLLAPWTRCRESAIGEGGAPSDGRGDSAPVGPAARPRFDPALFAPKGAAGGASPAPVDRAPDRGTAGPRAGGLDHRGEVAPPPALRRPSEPVAVVAGDAIRPIVDTVRPAAEGDATARLAELESRHARECPHCTVATAHERLVFGEGNPAAELVFVGEAPGENEDRLGRPFVGRAGEKLDEMIAAMGFRREEVYIANVLKSRPPDNRTPLAHEVERCGPYLLAQLAVIRPKVIVTLGGPATKLLLATELGITLLRGAARTVELGRAAGDPFEVPVMPTYHPAYLLRNYTRETRLEVWDDLKKVLAILGRTPPTRAG